MDPSGDVRAITTVAVNVAWYAPPTTTSIATPVTGLIGSVNVTVSDPGISHACICTLLTLSCSAGRFAGTSRAVPIMPATYPHGMDGRAPAHVSAVGVPDAGVLV